MPKNPKPEPDESVLDLYSRWEKAKAKVAAAEEEASLLKRILLSRIPAGKTRENVEHRVSEGRSVSYTKVVADMTDLVPKTQQSKIPKIIEKHTKSYEKHDFALLSPDL